MSDETAEAFKIIRAADLVRTPWRNGAGTTRDIASSLAPDGALLWQVGIADLERDGPFSHYPDCDRVFTPIAGDPPPELSFHGGPFEPCPLLVPKSFSGEWPTESRIPAPGQAFNAVFDRRHHTATVSVLHLAAGDPLRLPDATTLVLHTLTATLATENARLAPGDSLVTSEPTIFTAIAAGIALLVAITAPRPSGTQATP